MNKRGRPVQSDVRQNMIDILHFLKRAYGYELFKVYRQLFSPITLRLVYYHLKKGASLEEFKLSQVEKLKGHYSWGESSERILYELGSRAKPAQNDKVSDFFSKHPENIRFNNS